MREEMRDDHKRILGYKKYTRADRSAFPEVIGVGRILRVWVEDGVVHAVRMDAENNEIEWRAVDGKWEVCRKMKK